MMKLKILNKKGRKPKAEETSRPKRNNSKDASEVASTAKAKSKAEAKAAIAAAIAAAPASSSAAAAASSSAEAPVARKEHGVEIIENNNRKFWSNQNITVIKQQSELRGYRFTDLETKGGGGAKSKFKKFKKKDYLEVLYKLLKI